VASTGSGAACTRAAPCHNLSDAHDATAPGGAINCLDSGPFLGAVITKSITVDCAGVAATTSGIFFVGGAGIVVRFRNLTFDGAFGFGAGIDFVNGAALFVENCVMQNFNDGPATAIRFLPANVTGRLYVLDSVISNNGTATGGGGILVQPQGSGSARVALNRVTLQSNTHGIVADGTGSTGPIVVQVRNSVVAGGIGNGIAASTNAGASFTAFVVDRSSVLANAGSGILAQGSGALVHIGGSTVVGNGAGLNAAGGGQILSYQNNQATGNSFEGGPTGVLAVK
jgi:hypothetical protein